MIRHDFRSQDYLTSRNSGLREYHFRADRPRVSLAHIVALVLVAAFIVGALVVVPDIIISYRATMAQIARGHP